MTTQEVANRLHTLCSTGNWEQAQAELYHENCISIEPEESPSPPAHGIEAIKKKGEEWQSMVEKVYDSYTSEPIVGDNYFAVQMKTDVEFKGMGRMELNELAMYQVEDGKIIKEQFFYKPAPQQ